MPGVSMEGKGTSRAGRIAPTCTRECGHNGRAYDVIEEGEKLRYSNTKRFSPVRLSVSPQCGPMSAYPSLSWMHCLIRTAPKLLLMLLLHDAC